MAENYGHPSHCSLCLKRWEEAERKAAKVAAATELSLTDNKELLTALSSNDRKEALTHKE